MKNIYYLFIIGFILHLVLITGCNPPAGGIYQPSVIRGRTFDSATHKPLPGVNLWTSPTSETVKSDTGGYYIISNVPMSSSATNVWIFANRVRYIADTSRYWIYANDTFNLNISLLPENGVYVENDVILSQADNEYVESCIDLVYLRAVATINFRDIDLRDSANSRLKFQFRSSSLNTSNPGFATKFGNSLGSFTKAQFDTLAMYYGASSPLSEADFPRDRTDYFYTPLTVYSVVPFYLEGRHTPDPNFPKFYGLLYIKNSWLEAGSNVFRVQVDIKINQNGQNYFIPYTK
jgi:hypothetical protein